MHPGGKWSRDYKVAALADLDLTNPGRSKKVRVFRVREVLVPDEEKGYVFPLKEAADRAAGTIGKVAEDAAPDEVSGEAQNEDETGAPVLKPEDTPNVIREDTSLPKPEAADAGPIRTCAPCEGGGVGFRGGARAWTARQGQ